MTNERQVLRRSPSSRLSHRAGRRTRQQGLSLLGMLVAGVLVVLLVVIGMRVLPTVLEYSAIRKAITRTAASGATSTLEIQRSFDKIAAVEDISSITGRDLVIRRDNGALTLEFHYEKRIPLFGPASLLLDYQGTASGRPD